MTETAKLKPCPFCGSEPRFKQGKRNGQFFLDCPCFVTDFDNYTQFSHRPKTEKDLLVDRWNTRPLESELLAALESAHLFLMAIRPNEDNPGMDRQMGREMSKMYAVISKHREEQP